ncbi:AAA family ATPase [Polaribacter sp. HaHaR_3_91]|jgi:wobble nucleotide-excising tRNase|uniref:AAA family ATPase n=1 Tax=Polaribacter sp. HaHaR_3_91 TaxID=2745561 RepID=UPI001C4EAEFE|nr:AAA family ATPase [Polaribacter sp. HaHaR_3_91]QXP62720.1 AAA family ATPase [Polaribacter sp. HaHaR_3_91]
MIESILLKNIASYDQNGIEISNLKKVNFFFGANGSGKSTIAKYFHNLSKNPIDRISDFNDCSNNGYDQTNHQILVYDENFIDFNFNRNSVLKGVFSLNQTNDTIDREISTKQSEIETIRVSTERKQSLKQRIESNKRQKKIELLDFCWAKRNNFSSFSKLNLGFSGSKQNHLQQLKTILVNLPSTISSMSELSTSYNELYEKEILEIQTTISSSLYKEIRQLESELKPLISEIIVGNEDVNIDGLIKSLNSRSWVETGVNFLNEVDTTCPFCQKETIDENLRTQFNQYFDKTSKQQIELIENLYTQYKTKTTLFLENVLEIQSIFNPNNIVSNSYIQLQELFARNNNEIDLKIKNSNEKKDIISINTLKESLSTIINLIKTNNKALLELDQNKRNLISRIWAYLAEKSKTKIAEFEVKEIKYQKIDTLANQIIADYNTNSLTLKRQIEVLRSQTVNTQDAVENINLILKNSGFESFEIKEKDLVNNISQYYLKRPNTTTEDPIFKTLSEGEKSFISFLYFYQLCIGTDDITNNSSKRKIIVIDDPVSSLDSQALFVISSLIHQLILRKGNDNRPNKKLLKNENIAQVYILTHNLYFYKEVSFDRRPMCTDYWHYKISKINNTSSISGQYNKSITDDYAMLWESIKEIKINLPQDSSLNILIANSMRRIIESYVHFIGIGNDSWSSILNDDRQSSEYYLKYAFVASINDESHKVTALDGVYYQKISAEQPQLLFDVFKEIFSTIGRQHYEMMMDEQIITE